MGIGTRSKRRRTEGADATYVKQENTLAQPDAVGVPLATATSKRSKQTGASAQPTTTVKLPKLEAENGDAHTDNLQHARHAELRIAIVELLGKRKPGIGNYVTNLLEQTYIIREQIRDTNVRLQPRQQRSH